MFRTSDINEFKELCKISNNVYLVDENNKPLSEFIRNEYLFHYDFVQGSRIKYTDNGIVELYLDFKNYSLIIPGYCTYISTKYEGKTIYLIIENNILYFSETMDLNKKRDIDLLHYGYKQYFIKKVNKVIKDIEGLTMREELKKLILEKHLKIN